MRNIVLHIRALLNWEHASENVSEIVMKVYFCLNTCFASFE